MVSLWCLPFENFAIQCILQYCFGSLDFDKSIVECRLNIFCMRLFQRQGDWEDLRSIRIPYYVCIQLWGHCMRLSGILGFKWRRVFMGEAFNILILECQNCQIEAGKPHQKENQRRQWRKKWKFGGEEVHFSDTYVAILLSHEFIYSHLSKEKRKLNCLRLCFQHYLHKTLGGASDYNMDSHLVGKGTTTSIKWLNEN